LCGIIWGGLQWSYDAVYSFTLVLSLNEWLCLVKIRSNYPAVPQVAVYPVGISSLGRQAAKLNYKRGGTPAGHKLRVLLYVVIRADRRKKGCCWIVTIRAG